MIWYVPRLTIRVTLDVSAVDSTKTTVLSRNLDLALSRYAIFLFFRLIELSIFMVDAPALWGYAFIGPISQTHETNIKRGLAYLTPPFYSTPIYRYNLRGQQSKVKLCSGDWGATESFKERKGKKFSWLGAATPDSTRR